tara:strand:+ start:722 stop:1030 length:309 start_codon:yes stop_codon:yes gene_type:complete
MKSTLAVLVFCTAAILQVCPNVMTLAPLHGHLCRTGVAANLHLFMPLQLPAAPEPSNNQTFSLRAATKRVLGKMGRGFLYLHTAGREWNEEMYFDHEHPFFG